MPSRGHLGERRVRRALELDRDRRLALRHSLPDTDVEGRAGPAPVVDVELRGDERLRPRVGRDARLLPVAGHLLSLDEPGPYWPRTTRVGPGGRIACRTFTFSLRTESAVKSTGGSIAVSATSWSRWFWKTSRIAPAVLVEVRAALDPDRLGDGDLDVIDELAVPDRLEDAVREAQGEEVLDRLLAEVVVDPEDLALLEVALDLRHSAAVRSHGRCRTASRRSRASSPCHSSRRAPIRSRSSRSRSAGPRGRRRGFPPSHGRGPASQGAGRAGPRPSRPSSRRRRSASRRPAGARPSRRSGHGRTP